MMTHPLIRAVARPVGAARNRSRAFAQWSVMVASLFALPALFPATALAQPHEGERAREHAEERHDDRQERRDDRQEHRDDRKEQRADDRHERREDRRDQRHDDHVERREEQGPGAQPAMGARSGPAPMMAPARPIPPGPGPRGPAPGFMGGPVRGAPPAGPVMSPAVRGAPPTAPRAFHPRFAPPPPIVEQPVPRAGFVWAPGYYDWADDRYLWVGGHYEPERRDAYWSPPRWELQGGLFSWLPGGWISVTAGPAVAPPAPPPEPVMQPRPGFVWIPGNYEWRGNQYVWVAGSWQGERSNEQWHPGRWERHGNHWAWHRGGWHRH